MAIRFDSIRSAILIGMLAACFTESACADYVVQSSYVGAIAQQDGSYYFYPGFAAFGNYGDSINYAYAGFNLQSNYSNIQSITVSGSVFGATGNEYGGSSTPLVFYLVSGQTADLTSPGGSNYISYNSTFGAQLFNGISTPIGGVGAFAVIPEGESDFSATISDPLGISETIAAAQSNGGFIVFAFPPNTGEFLTLDSASLAVHYGTTVSPQSVVPEPASLALACIGGAAIAIGRRAAKKYNRTIM